MIVNYFSTIPRNISILRRLIPHVCYEKTIIPEEDLKKLLKLFYISETLAPNKRFPDKIVKKLHKLLFQKITVIMIERYLNPIGGTMVVSNEFFIKDWWTKIFERVEGRFIGKSPRISIERIHGFEEDKVVSL